MATKTQKYKYVRGIQCPRCEEKLWSKYTHDFHYCGCGYCFVDGGRDYLRLGWGVHPEGKPNATGFYTKEQYDKAKEETDKIGVPNSVRIRVPLAELKQYEKSSRFPY